MDIEIVEQSLGLLVVSDEMLHAVNRRLPVVTHQIVSIEIMALRVQSVQALLDAVWIEHGNNHYLEMFPQCFGIVCIADKEVDHAFHCPARCTFAWVHAAAY